MVTQHTTKDFDGARVICFESRMAEAMAASIRSHGGVPLTAPAVRELPLDGQQEAFAFGQALLDRRIDVIICLTGVGTRLLLNTLATRIPREELVQAFGRTTVVARGPKPLRVLAEFRIPVAISVPEPNTWHEIVRAIDLSERGLELAGRTVAIQEYGTATAPLIEALKQRGAAVLRVPVYRWALPEDLTPLRSAIQALLGRQAAFTLFTNAAQVRHLLEVASTDGQAEPLREAFRDVVVASVGPTTSEALADHGLPVDFEPSRPKMGPLIDELARDAASLLEAKRREPAVRVPPVRSEPADSRALRREAPFLKACRREPAGVTPVWLMRQAGRYLKSYRDIRNRVPFLALCKDRELATEVTVAAVEQLGVDAAIIFSDILLIVEPLGFGLAYESGEGPVISGTIGGVADVDRLREIEPAESLRFVFEAIQLTRSVLRPQIPLIGFAGAPFTLAAYILEGGSSSAFVNTKRLMYTDAGAWHALLEKISRGLVKLLNGQIDSGADAVQLFDTWAGALSPHDYRTYVLPHTQAVIRGLAPGVPVIHFGTGTSAFLGDVAAAGGDVVGVDFRIGLDQAWKAIGPQRGIQGNLDPAVLFAEPAVIRDRVAEILRQADGRPGHIFNLGHGVLPATPVDHVVAMVEAVHELSRR